MTITFQLQLFINIRITFAFQQNVKTIPELGNNDLRNQRTRVCKNSYVAKNQTKVPVGVTFWAPVYLTMKKTKKKLLPVPYLYLC